jgi:CheY-like chemotaxis protein
VEDDFNDAEVIVSAIKDLGLPNEIKHMRLATEAYDYLMRTDDKPFIILCDVRMPIMNGLEFRKKIVDTEYLRRKSIPFVFYTVLVSQEIVNEAYDLHVQGFYEKAKSYEGIKDQLHSILTYWKQCIHPNRNFAK